MTFNALYCVLGFQSTLSVRRATALHGVGQRGFGISIHALREESDALLDRCRAGDIPFQSTLSVRRATIAAIRTLKTLDGFQSTLSVRRATVQLDIFVRFLRRKPAA